MLVSAGRDLKEPLLIALAEREDANRSGKMVVSCYIIICIFCKGMQICAWVIDDETKWSTGGFKK